MFTRVLPFSVLTSQGRWKVEFFTSDRAGPASKAYPLVRLRELLSERREFLDPQQYPDHLFNYLGLEHVLPVTGDLADGYQPVEGKEVLSRCKVFRRGDILYGRLRPSLNKVIMADGAIPEGICSGEFYVLIPEAARILPHFTRALLASRYVQDVVKSMTSGSALPRLALEDLLDIKIPLPPLDTQRQYEELLLTQNTRRRRMMDELRDGPAADLEAVVSALEEGTGPTLNRPPQPVNQSFAHLTLPRAGLFPARGRGRPARKQGDLLF